MYCYIPQVASLQQRIEEKSSTVKTQSAQILKLSSIIGEADEETKAQTKQYTTIIHEQVQLHVTCYSVYLMCHVILDHWRGGRRNQSADETIYYHYS